MSKNTDKFKFHMVNSNDERMSSTWHIMHHKENIYIYVSVLGGRYKLSIHPKLGNDGNNAQIGFEKKFRKDKSIFNKQVLQPHRWRVPKVKKGEAVGIVMINFPTNHLTSPLLNHTELESEPFTLPGKNKAIEFSVLVLKKTDKKRVIKELNHYSMIPFKEWSLNSTDSMFITKRVIDFNEKILPKGKIGNGYLFIPKEDFSESQKNTRSLIVCKPKNGGVIKLVESGNLKPKVVEI